ncbi:MAG: BadF/BadG/BcrA/BcrD ATPase family protein [Colwellia sp.]
MLSQNKHSDVTYVLGIDGGGSKTIACLIHLVSQKRWQVVAGPSSLTNDFSGAVKVLKFLIDEVISQAKCKSNEISAVFGLAGASHSENVAKLNKMFCNDFAVFDLCNDAKISAFGANNGKEVAVISLGTGSVGLRLQKNSKGELVDTIVGGWGFFIDDEGGGAKLGYHAMRALVAEYQHVGKIESKLGQAVAAFIHKKTYTLTRQNIAVWLSQAKPIDFAKLSPLVTKHQNDCPVAKQIIVNHVMSVESLITDTLAKSNLPVILVGGLAHFTESILSEKSKGLLISAKGSALDGACLLANIQLNQFNQTIQ